MICRPPFLTRSSGDGGAGVAVGAARRFAGLANAAWPIDRSAHRTSRSCKLAAARSSLFTNAGSSPIVVGGTAWPS